MKKDLSPGRYKAVFAKRGLLLFALSLFPVLLLYCVKSPEESEKKPLALYEVAGGKIFAVDGLGSRKPLEYTRALINEEIKYREILLTSNKDRLLALTYGGTVTAIDLANKVEQPLFELSLPAGQGVMKARLGWAGQRLYVLSRTADQGVALSELDLIKLNENLLAGRLDSDTLGLGPPASFDLAAGGNQALILYPSGVIRALNLYMPEPGEGVWADLGVPASDLHAMADGSVFAAAADGLYHVSSGGTVDKAAALDSLLLCRVRSPEMKEVFALESGGGLFGVFLDEGREFFYLGNPEPVSSLAPVDYNWIKNTKTIIEKPIAYPPIKTTFPFNYQVSFSDPEGDHGTATLTLEPSPGQNAYFVDTGDGRTVFEIFPTPSDYRMLSIYPGDTTGVIRVRIEVVSDDGQVSVREDEVNVSDRGEPPTIQEPISNPPYYVGMENQYLVYFTDPEGQTADLTITLAADPAQGVYFTGAQNQDTVLFFPGVSPGQQVDASFFGGSRPGQVSIRIEALSADGQSAERTEALDVVWRGEGPQIEDLQASPCYATASSTLVASFTDADGDPADLTITLLADPAQGVYFTSMDGSTVVGGSTVVTKHDLPPNDLPLNPSYVNLTFYCGDQPGAVTVRVEAVSVVDGRTASREFPLTVQ